MIYNAKDEIRQLTDIYEIVEGVSLCDLFSAEFKEQLTWDQNRGLQALRDAASRIIKEAKKEQLKKIKRKIAYRVKKL